MNAESLLATRTRNMGASAIREILKVVSRPGTISLAGGIPAPESFPMADEATLTRAIEILGEVFDESLPGFHDMWQE